MGEPVRLLLDTNHLSDLATKRAATGASVVSALESGTASLVVTWTHLIELSAPGFRGYPDVRALLRSVPHVLANPFQEVFEEELAVACALATGRTRPPPRAFARDTSGWGFRGGPVGGDAVDLLDANRESPDLRKGLLDTAEWSAQSSMMKRAAAIVRDPDSAILAALRKHLQDHRFRLPSYADGLTAEEILARVGGRSAFPGYNAQEATLTQRLTDDDQKSTRNDVFDEYLVFYAPYSGIIAVDKRTLHRARNAGLTCSDRMTRHLSDVEMLMEQYREGRLSPVQASR